MKNSSEYKLRVKRLGIDTYKEAVVYIHQDCYVSRAEGFEAQARVQISDNKSTILATLNLVKSDLVQVDEAGLSEYAWQLLGVKENDKVTLKHPKPLHSLSYIRSKIYGKRLSTNAIHSIVEDTVAGYLSDIYLSAFITACAGVGLNQREITDLTQAMVDTGDYLSWHNQLVVDKHCVGGLPGNRTSLIVVPIVAEFGLTIPKTSSRAITSPAGTADTMEVFAPVDLDITKIRRVVEKENGCIVWGGAVSLSPADDMLIRIERSLDLDSEDQLIASVLSKKIAAGSTCALIDIPIGPTAKIRDQETAKRLKKNLQRIGKNLGITISAVFTDGSQPIGRGIGPALEARDVMSVLRNEKNAPQDLRERSLLLAGKVLEFSPKVKRGSGQKLAQEILQSGGAWKKFQAICDAQGGMRMPVNSKYIKVIVARVSGIVFAIDNRRLANVAKLAGAPKAKAAGVELHVQIGASVDKGQPLFTIHSETPGELSYALMLLRDENQIISIGKKL